MIQRHKRRPELYDIEKQALLEALRQCRSAIIESGRHLHPWSPTYRLGGPVIEAIDDLTGELTGDRRFCHARSSTL